MVFFKGGKCIMNPLISIIVPIYNCDKFIVRLVNSVTKQNYNNYELILINDGSTDNTISILEKIKDDNIKIINKKNTGVSDSRNLGLELSKGKYICFLDADDYIDEKYLVEINEILKVHPDVELINFGFYSDVENEKLETMISDKISYIDKKYDNRKELKNDLINLYDNTMLYNIWNKVYKAEILKSENIKFPNYNWGEDVEFNRLYLNKINTMYNSSNAFYHYIRERKGAATKEYKSKLFEIRKQEYFEFNEYFEKWGIPKKAYEEFSCRRFIERILGCIENIYCSDINFKNRYKQIKRIINDDITQKCLKNAIPKSKKIKMMLIPIKLKITILVMIMGKLLHVIKNKYPAIFNKLKNKR